MKSYLGWIPVCSMLILGLVFSALWANGKNIPHYEDGDGWIEVRLQAAMAPDGEHLLARAVVGPTVTDDHGHRVRPTVVVIDYCFNSPISAKTIRQVYPLASTRDPIAVPVEDPNVLTGKQYRSITTLQPKDGTTWESALNRDDFLLDIRFEETIPKSPAHARTRTRPRKNISRAF